ncbi:hypothetical protein FRC08_013714, partial [Ceratobasidium sp. 394]
MESISDVLVTQSRLVQAASDFFNACTTFRSDLAARRHNSASRSNLVALESILDKVRSVVDSIALVENKIHNSRAVLNGSLNQSPARVPINSLPSEILSRIFSIAVSSTACFPPPGHRDAMLDIPLVCARWHQIAMNTLSLWSHIDVRVGPSASARVSSFNRLQVFMDRCRGMPIHLHLDTTCNTAKKDAITEFISTLQPHAAFLSSLTTLGNSSAPWTRALFTLFPSYDTPNAMKKLVISENMRDGVRTTIVLPTCPFQGLVCLELLGPRDDDILVSVGELATAVSNCPALHTLLLRNLWIPSEPLQKYAPIHLPSLQVFQIHDTYGHGVQLFLSMLHPGRLELDVRLEMESVGDDEFISCVRSLLARSNVVSLTADLVSDPPMEFTSYISAVPCLRALILDVLHQESPELLGGLLRDSVAQLPRLQSLGLIGCNMEEQDMERVKRV